MKDKGLSIVRPKPYTDTHKDRIEFTEASHASFLGFSKMLSNHMIGGSNDKDKALSALESFIQSVPGVAIQLIDVNSTIRFWNQASESLYGYPSEFAIGKRFDKLLLKDAEHQAFTQMLQKAWQNKTLSPVSCWQLTSAKEEKLWVYGNFLPYCKDEKVYELFAIQVTVTADDKFGNLFFPLNEKQGFGELEGHIQQRINKLVLANEKFHKEILVRAHFEKGLLESEASLKQKVVQQTIDLNKTMSEIEHKNQELIQYKNELEVLNEELLETNKAVSVLARNMEKRKEKGIEKTNELILEKILPAVENIKSIEKSPLIKSELELIARYLRELTDIDAKSSSAELNLSVSEMKVASMIKNGFSTKEIAGQMGVSMDTIKTHRKNIRKKLGIVNSRIDLENFLLSKFK